MSDLNNLLKALNRNAEITALSVALHGKPTCVLCGLFATRCYENGVWEHPTLGCRLMPDFCSECDAGECSNLLVPLPGARAAKRLNHLLRNLE